jgi:hypothetical protein
MAARELCQVHPSCPEIFRVGKETISELLEMQWFLQRVTGIAGAADVDVDLGEEGPDDDIKDLQDLNLMR